MCILPPRSNDLVTPCLTSHLSYFLTPFGGYISWSTGNTEPCSGERSLAWSLVYAFVCVCQCVWGVLELEGLRGIFFFCSSVHVVTSRSLSLSVASTGEGVWEAKHNKQGQEELAGSWETRPRMFLHMLGKQAHQKLRDCGRTGSRQALKKNCGQSGLQWCCCGNENES